MQITDGLCEWQLQISTKADVLKSSQFRKVLILLVFLPRLQNFLQEVCKQSFFISEDHGLYNLALVPTKDMHSTALTSLRSHENPSAVGIRVIVLGKVRRADNSNLITNHSSTSTGGYIIGLEATPIC